MRVKLLAPHPMNPNVSWSTAFTVEIIGNSVMFIQDITNSNGMSVTNNMEHVLISIAHHFHIWETDLHTKYTIYQIDTEAVYKVEHDGCLDPKWHYIGPDDKALRVLYGKV